MLESFRVEVRPRTAGRCDVSVAGELDVVTVEELRHVLQQAVMTYPCTVVDLGGVRFCDCTGLSALLAARHRAKEHGTELRLRTVPIAVARLLRLTHTSDAFTIEPAGRPGSPPSQRGATAYTAAAAGPGHLRSRSRPSPGGPSGPA
ncbi:Putative anti-sigma factor antagonist [Streptomyces sp. ADI95-16]|nr:STAS domain-containing protein [Streptomyces sp. ADI95-16]AYV26373.1 Putative anti-sigma factor antagonist [Streptomyces sp. ADI95-16]